MATIKRLARFQPTPPPQNIPIALQEWLREEFERITLASNGALDTVDILKAIPRMILAGDADNFNLDTSDSQFVNYTQGGALGEVPIDPDPVAGTITIPLPGAYRVTVYAIGMQGNNQQNATIFLGVGVNGVITTITTFDVTTNQTADRSFAATLSRAFVSDDVITMHLTATHDMDVFSVDQTSLELTLITPLDSGDIDIDWFP